MKLTIIETEQKTTQGGKLFTIAKDNQGNHFSIWDSGLAQKVEIAKNKPIEYSIKETQGRDGNVYKQITGILTPQSAPTVPQNAKNGLWKRDPAESRLIVRQSSLAQAVAFWSRSETATLENVLDTAEAFADWVLESKKTSTVQGSGEPLPILPVIQRDEMNKVDPF